MWGTEALLCKREKRELTRAQLPVATVSGNVPGLGSDSAGESYARGNADVEYRPVQKHGNGVCLTACGRADWREMGVPHSPRSAQRTEALRRIPGRARYCPQHPF